MSRLDYAKIYEDIRKFIYKYTHEAALTYPFPSDYVEMANDMHYSKIILRIKFPEQHHLRPGQTMERLIYDSGKPCGEEMSYKYIVSMGGEVEVVYFVEEGFELDEDDRKLYQWICDQIFLVYGKQQVVDVLNLVSKVHP
ncbi:MAG: hypothetical protein ILA13_09700 [Eubacterium sp.]|nr:hypothetical protein [Eubacterium sp.]